MLATPRDSDTLERHRVTRVTAPALHDKLYEFIKRFMPAPTFCMFLNYS